MSRSVCTKLEIFAPLLPLKFSHFHLSFLHSPSTQGTFYIVLWFRIQHTDAGDRTTGRLSKSQTTINNIIFEFDSGDVTETVLLVLLY